MKTIISITALLATLISFNAMAGVAGGTRVQIDSKTMIDAEELTKGQSILTATEGSTKNSIHFQPSTLIFADSSATPFTAVFMGFGDDRMLIMTLDQSVLTTSGKLIPVSDLVPGQDQLVDASGNPVNINFLSIDRFNGRIVDFAPDSNNVTENLYLANGVILGSFKINLSLNPSKKIEAFVGQVLDF